jgi:hypothetical protein
LIPLLVDYYYHQVDTSNGGLLQSLVDTSTAGLLLSLC